MTSRRKISLARFVRDAGKVARFVARSQTEVVVYHKERPVALLRPRLAGAPYGAPAAGRPDHEPMFVAEPVAIPAAAAGEYDALGQGDLFGFPFQPLEEMGGAMEVERACHPAPSADDDDPSRGGIRRLDRGTRRKLRRPAWRRMLDRLSPASLFDLGRVTALASLLPRT